MLRTTVQNEVLDWLIEIFDRTLAYVETETEPTLVIFNGAVLNHDPNWIYD
jgi:hypothetical protein